jgi:SPRY domain-containing SOCS box protein 3
LNLTFREATYVAIVIEIMSNQEQGLVDSNDDAAPGEESQSLCEWTWNDKDCGKGSEVHKDKRRVTFHRNKSVRCAAVRGIKALAPNMEHYFEVEIGGPFFGQALVVGIGTGKITLQSNNLDFYPLIGKDLFSWGVNYDGKKVHGGEREKYARVKPEEWSILQIGVHFDSYHGHLSFDFNGESHGIAFDKVITGINYYPMLCASAHDTEMKLLQCCSSVMPLKALCRGVIRSQVTNERDFEKLVLPTSLKSYLVYNKRPRTDESHHSRKKGSGSRRNHKVVRESSI